MGFYVYRVTGRPDGLEWAVHQYGNERQIHALFAEAGACKNYLDGLRAQGHAVDVLPTAEEALR